MADPAYPTLEGESGPIGFEGLSAGEKKDHGGSFSVQFTPSAGDAVKLTDEDQRSYRTFEGEQPHASNEEISLLERKTQNQSEEEKVKSAY